MKRTLLLSIALLIILPLNESCKQVEKVTDDAIEYSLNKLGDTFFSLIADSPEKEEMLKKYNDFVQRSVNGEVEQDQIEYVAANILNVSNSQDRITPQFAANIVETTHPMNQSPSDDMSAFEERKVGLDESSRKSLGDKLSKILDFNEKLMESYTKRDFSDKVFYKFEEGIEINIDDELKSSIEEMEKSFEGIAMIKQEMDFTWVKDLSENLKKEQAKFEEEMKNLENLKGLQSLKKLDGMAKLENLKNLKELKNLEKMKILENLDQDFKFFLKDGKYKQFYFNDTSFVMPDIPQVNLDSIMESVEKALEEAGIK